MTERTDAEPKKSLGVMIDCSRNGVMSVGTLKEFASLLAGMGYNLLMLYTEDTYEITGEPYFGYLRGRYSKEELKETDAYCRSLGIELVPCIQTLAHLGRLKRWPAYEKLFDVDDILLAEDERVNRLIDKMFDTLSECFTTRRAHIGMDEAHRIGLGRYLDRNGFRNRTEIMGRHLEKVKEIAGRHGFSVMIWSDMFLRLNNGGQYYGKDLSVPEETVNAVPEGVELIYWDYYSKDPERYDAMFRTHEAFARNPVGFAGGLWTWNGFVPNLSFAIDATEAAMTALKRHSGVRDVFFTLWGDNGKECSYFSALPALFAAAEMYRGTFDRKVIAERFSAFSGYTFGEFMRLESPNIPEDGESSRANPSKYLLYNDPFLGIFDSLATEEMPERYRKAAEEVRRSVNGRRFDRLFEFTAKLLDVLSLKCGLGQRIRAAYGKGDRETLKTIASEDLPELTAAIRELCRTEQKIWLQENKGFGLEVLEYRFGGLILRLESCAERLMEFSVGRTEKIDELEEPLLPAPDLSAGGGRFNRFLDNYTACNS